MNLESGTVRTFPKISLGLVARQRNIFDALRAQASANPNAYRLFRKPASANFAGLGDTRGYTVKIDGDRVEVVVPPDVGTFVVPERGETQSVHGRYFEIEGVVFKNRWTFVPADDSSRVFTETEMLMLDKVPRTASLRRLLYRHRLFVRGPLVAMSVGAAVAAFAPTKLTKAAGGVIALAAAGVMALRDQLRRQQH